MDAAELPLGVASGGTPARVLVVEDDGIVAMAITRALGKLGYRSVGVVATGEEAVDRAMSTMPDVVLMDIRLKGTVDGIEAASRIHERADVPIVYLTAYSDDETVARAKVTGAAGFIVKPFDDRDLRAGIEVALYNHSVEAAAKRTSEAVAASERLLRDILDRGPVLVYVRDVAGRFLFMNKRFRTIFGFPPESEENPTNAPAEADRLPAAVATMFAAHERFVLSRGEPMEVDESIELPDGLHAYISYKFPIYADGAVPTGVGVVSADVTAHRRLEIELRRIGAALETAVERRTADLTRANEDLEAFTRAVSHDLRGPLRRIEALAGDLEESQGEHLPTDAMEDLRRVHSEVRRLGAIVGGLLELSMASRRRELHVETIDITQMAQTILAELRARDPERLVEAHVERGLTVDGDPLLIRVALENLLGNAWKFTRTRSPGRIDVGSTLEPDGVAIFVTDNGVGFDPREGGRLFEPFHRLHHSADYEGTGLGLSTVRRIIERHGGQVHADGRPGVGATFTFSLPRRERPALPVPPTP